MKDTRKITAEHEEKINVSSVSRGKVKILLAASIWGLGGFFVRKMNALAAPATLTSFTGHAFALLPLLIYILIKKGWAGLKISPRGLVLSIILGIVTKGIFQLAYDSTTIILGAALSSILLYLSPVFSALLSAIFLKEKLDKNQYLALTLNVLGCVLAVSGGNFSNFNLNWAGLGLGILAAVLYALNTVLSKVAVTEDDSLTTTFYMLLASSVTLTFLAEPWKQSYFFSNQEFLKWAIINALSTGMLANTLFFSGLEDGVEASTASVLASAEVIVACLTGVLLLAEKINFVSIFGIIILLLSIFLMQESPKPLNKKMH